MIDYLSEAESQRAELIAMRRDFHRHPELGFQEIRTSGVVAARLNALGLEVQTGVGRTGVVGLLEGGKSGPVVMLRFDMDALPISEANAVDYASQTPGVMHACGHDGHTAIGLALARLLARHRDELAGTVKFVFQPAEEGMGGAQSMIDDGVLANPRPDVALGLHLWNPLPAGRVGLQAGPIMAAAEILHVRLTGQGGHGAAPHETADPVIAAAQVISALQAIVSRNVPPLESAVVTVATVHGGTTFNVIPQIVELSGTIRTFQPAVRTRVLARVHEVISGVAGALGCSAEIDIKALTPAVVNDRQVSEVVYSAVVAMAGPQAISAERTLGSEDMACFLREVPGCFFFVGSADPARGLDHPHHNDRFDFDEQALVNGAAILYKAAGQYLFEGAGP
jgi:amidohydrolase